MNFRKKYVWKKEWNRRSRNEYLQAIRRFSYDAYHEEDDLEYYRTQVFEYREEKIEYINLYSNDRDYDPSPVYPY